jgi:signal transduction histidine kinase
MAAMAAEKVRMVLGQAEDELVARVERAVADPRGLTGGLSTLQASAPLIARLALLDRRGPVLFDSASAGLDARSLTAIFGQVPDGLWDRGGRRHLRLGDQVLLLAVVRPPAAAPLLAVVWHDVEVLRRVILARTLGTLEGPTIVAVVDEQDRPVYLRQPLEDADRVATATLGDGLPAWRVALYQPAGLSPRTAVRRQVALFTIAFGLLLLVIVAGLVATWRLVRRETQMARLKADFVANVSHDLKTPLSLIRMFAETLEMGRLPDEAARQEYYRVLTRESERLSRLIDNVLDFSRIDRGRRTYDLVPTQVEPLVRETVEAFGHVLAQQGFRVEVRIAPDLIEVPMDGGAVAQALGNLIDNAIKYSGDRKSLGVDARIDGDHLALTVADEGIGIPPAEHARIFEQFYRVGRSETQGRRGSGVGLALVKHVVDAHGGRVTVESRPGRGSRFTLWLPVRRSAAG